MSERRRAPQPEDLYGIHIATDPRLSPDGAHVAFVEQTAGPGRTDYRSAIWLVRADGSGPPRQVTLGAKRDTQPRFSPDGRTLAFLSDRRPLVEEEPRAPKEREDATQVHLLPLDGPGEARRLTDLPRGVDELAWSPDGTKLAILTPSRGATREADARARGRREAKPGEPRSDYRYMDRLGYQVNGAGFTLARQCQLWVVDAASGEARQLTNVPAGIEQLAWSPDGTRIAIPAQPVRDYDLVDRSQIVVVDVESGRQTTVAGAREGIFFSPARAAGRQDARGARRPVPRRVLRERRLVVQCRWVGCRRRRRPRPHEPARPDAGVHDEQRPRRRRRAAPVPDTGRTGDPLPRAVRWGDRPVARRHSRRERQAPHDGPPRPVRLRYRRPAGRRRSCCCHALLADRAARRPRRRARRPRRRR